MRELIKLLEDEKDIKCRLRGKELRIICSNGSYKTFHEIMLSKHSDFKSDDEGFSITTILLGKAYIVRKYRGDEWVID